MNKFKLFGYAFFLMSSINAFAITKPAADGLSPEHAQDQIDGLIEQRGEIEPAMEAIRNAKVGEAPRPTLAFAHDYHRLLCSQAMNLDLANGTNTYRDQRGESILDLASIILRHRYVPRGWGRGLYTAWPTAVDELLAELTEVVSRHSDEKTRELGRFWQAACWIEKKDAMAAWQLLDELKCHRTGVSIMKARVILSLGYCPAGLSREDAVALAEKLMRVEARDPQRASVNGGGHGQAQALPSANAINYSREREELQKLLRAQRAVAGDAAAARSKAIIPPSARPGDGILSSRDTAGAGGAGGAGGGGYLGAEHDDPMVTGDESEADDESDGTGDSSMEEGEAPKGLAVDSGLLLSKIVELVNHKKSESEICDLLGITRPKLSHYRIIARKNGQLPPSGRAANLSTSEKQIVLQQLTEILRIKRPYSGPNSARSLLDRERARLNQRKLSRDQYQKAYRKVMKQLKDEKR